MIIATPTSGVPTTQIILIDRAYAWIVSSRVTGFCIVCLNLGAHEI